MAQEMPNVVPNQYIIQLQKQATIDEAIAENPSIRPIENLVPDMKIWLVNGDANNQDFLLALKKNKAIKIAQYNHTVAKRFVPNDPLFLNQWNMRNVGQGSGTPLADIRATKAWDISTSAVTTLGDSVVLAIIENDMDLFHSDINYFINYGEIPNDSIDNDGNGYIDDYNGWDCFNNQNYANGGDVHAIHVAGIAGAIGNNGIGVTGVCMGAKILPVAGSSGDEAVVVKAYRYIIAMRQLYAATNGAKGAFVVATNSSFGIGSYGTRPADAPIWCAMYDSLGKYGILSAVAGPNADVNVDVVHDVPSECPSDFVISVTNTDRYDKKSAGAAYGPISMDIGAPGTGVFSTFPSNAYNYLSGTSMATPHVCGAVGATFAMACPAFMQQYRLYPDSFALIVKKNILQGADWNLSLEHKISSSGRLNLYNTFLHTKEFNCDSCAFSLSNHQQSLACANDSTGSIAIFPKGMTYLWNDSITTTDSVFGLKSGVYTVSVTDTSGCTLQQTIQINPAKNILLTNINIVPVRPPVNGSVIVAATSGNDVLNYSLNNSAFQSSYLFSIDTAGYYTLTIRNQSGCELDTTIYVSSHVGIIAVENLPFSIYPNPAADFVFVDFKNLVADEYVLQIHSLLGQTVLEQKIIATSEKINLQNIANGSYIISLYHKKKKLSSQPLIINR